MCGFGMELTFVDLGYFELGLYVLEWGVGILVLLVWLGRGRTLC